MACSSKQELTFVTFVAVYSWKRASQVRFSLLIDYSCQRSLQAFSLQSDPRYLAWQTSLLVSCEPWSRKRQNNNKKKKVSGERKALLSSTMTPSLPSGMWAKCLLMTERSFYIHQSLQPDSFSSRLPVCVQVLHRHGQTSPSLCQGNRDAGVPSFCASAGALPLAWHLG